MTQNCKVQGVRLEVVKDQQTSFNLISAIPNPNPPPKLRAPACLLNCQQDSTLAKHTDSRQACSFSLFSGSGLFLASRVSLKSESLDFHERQDSFAVRSEVNSAHVPPSGLDSHQMHSKASLPPVFDSFTNPSRFVEIQCASSLLLKSNWGTN